MNGPDGVNLTGTGTSSDPYIVYTGRGLAYFSYLYESSVSTSIYIQLGADIDLSDYWWTPIGGKTADLAFAGQFNGKNHTISGLYIKDIAGRTSNYGLFGKFKSGMISLLNITDSYICASGTKTGTIVGEGTGATLIVHCTSSATVVTTNGGGIAGEFSGNGILGCNNNGNVPNGAGICYSFPQGSSVNIIKNINRGAAKFGISGIVKGRKIKDCYNYGPITGGAGIVGEITNDGSYIASITACFNAGNVVNGSGIVANASVDVVDCVNNGTITGTGSYGGIAGNGLAIRNCYNFANVSGRVAGGIATIASEITDCLNHGLVTGTIYAGGISGMNNGTISRCLNYGEIVSDTGTSGGIAAESMGIIQNCANFGKISGSDAGGIVGTLFESTSLSNCVNEGEIHGKSYAGGIAATSETPISQCDNYGDVYCSGSVLSSEVIFSGFPTGGIGGIVGVTTIAQISDCNNFGSLEMNYGHDGAFYMVGGIVGYAVPGLVGGTKISFINCSNYGCVVYKTEPGFSSLANSTLVALGGLCGGVDENSIVSVENCVVMTNFYFTDETLLLICRDTTGLTEMVHPIVPIGSNGYGLKRTLPVETPINKFYAAMTVSFMEKAGIFNKIIAGNEASSLDSVTGSGVTLFSPSGKFDAANLYANYEKYSTGTLNVLDAFDFMGGMPVIATINAFDLPDLTWQQNMDWGYMTEDMPADSLYEFGNFYDAFEVVKV